MFTGIVEELAQIKAIVPKKHGALYIISAQNVMDDLEFNFVIEKIKKTNLNIKEYL